MGENGFPFSPISRHLALAGLRSKSVQKWEKRNFSYLQVLLKSVQKWEKIDFRFFPFLDTFCRFSSFQTLFLLFLDPKLSRNGRKLIFVFSHFQTLFVVSPVSRHFFSYYFQIKTCLEMGETQFLLFIGIFEKCLEIGETQFLLFIDTFEKCIEMGET